MSHIPGTPEALAGIGLKPMHMGQLLELGPARFVSGAGFLEVHAENLMVDGGPVQRQLDRVRERWPLSIHGVGLSIGGEGPLDRAHLDRLRQLLRRFEPRWFSEHLAWSSHGGHWFNDLLPLPYDTPTLNRVCDHIDQVQAHLGRPLLLENPSTYLGHTASTMDEASFLAAVCQRTGCRLLLDVNNAYVSGINHGVDPWQLIAALPADAVGEIHLAGFADDGDAASGRLLIDHHGAAVDAAVWELYARAIGRLGPVPTLIERDNHIPALAVLEAEASRALAIQHSVQRPAAATGRCAAAARSAQAPTSATAAPSQPGNPAAQHAFAAALLDPRLPVPAGLAAWNGSDPGIRFDVYRNNVMHSLSTVLADTFTVVRELVGDEFFAAMARAFIRDCPPASPLMHRYGQAFPAWVAQFEPAAALPYLADVARLELSRLEAYHAADASPMAPDTLTRALLDPERLARAALVLHPSVTVLRSPHPVLSLWQAHQAEGPQRDALLADISLDTAESALVFRSGDDPLVLGLPAADAALAADLAAGSPLGHAQASHPRADATRLLAVLLQHGLVIALSPPVTPSFEEPAP